MNDSQRELIFNDAFQARLRALREAKGWSADQTARFLGIPADRYRKYETRSMLPLYLLEPAAQLFDCDLQFLITGKAFKEKPLSGHSRRVTAA